MNQRKPKTKIIENGDSVTCRITGFKGIVTSITEFLGGCSRVGVKSQELHEGKPIPTQIFDLADLTVDKKHVVAAEEVKPGEIRLGDQVEDKTTKFRGIATSITTEITGRRGIGVTPEMTDKDSGKLPDPHVFDEMMVAKVVEQKHDEPEDKTPGGNQRVPGLR